MPYKSKAQAARKCRWCDQPAKKWLDREGRFKTYQRTCGSEKCVTAQYRDAAVGKSKRYAKPKLCEKCDSEYIATNHQQRWCKVCAPSKSAMGRLQRYNISASEFQNMIDEQGGVCILCEQNPAVVIDHSHISGDIRGVLCNGCNFAIGRLESEGWLKKAREYVSLP